MKTTRSVVYLGAILVVAASLGRFLGAEETRPTSAVVYQHTQTLRPYQVFDLTIIVSQEVDDSAWMTDFPVEFLSPSGKRFTVGGFYFGPARDLLPWLTGKEKATVQEALAQGGPGTSGKCGLLHRKKARGNVKENCVLGAGPCELGDDVLPLCPFTSLYGVGFALIQIILSVLPLRTVARSGAWDRRIVRVMEIRMGVCLTQNPWKALSD